MTDLLRDLRCAYLVHEEIVVGDLPPETVSVKVHTAFGRAIDATMRNGKATIGGLGEGTHVLSARSASGELLAEEFFGVRHALGEDPIMGFVTSFDKKSQPSVLSWLRRLRCSVVQIYDWMESYSTPLATTDSYLDPLGRPIELSVLKELIAGIKSLGTVAQAYAPVIAADAELADAHPEWRLFRSDGAPQSLGDLLQIMDPANIEWQQHWIDAYGDAADKLGFNGFHLDTYGYPRAALSSSGAPVEIARGYVDFVDAVRKARSSEVLSFNQVNGVPRGFITPGSPSFRYVEVWAPNDQWRHLEGLLSRSAGPNERHGDTLAIYPPVWEGARDAALRTGILSQAIVTTLGSNTLIWGDDHGVLRHPYYVNHEQLRDEEIDTVLQWHRFNLRCRDLFKIGTDTSWYELDDENAAVVVSWDGVTSPEPLGGSLYARVIRGDDSVVVSLLDLSGSADGSWLKGTALGRCARADVSILVEAPEQWRADVAVLGHDEGRFAPLELGEKSLREGRGCTSTVPIDGGWSVLRLTRRKLS
jgi:dextranase